MQHPTDTPSVMGPFYHCTLIVSLESYALFSVRGSVCLKGTSTRHPAAAAFRLMYGLYAGFCHLGSGISKINRSLWQPHVVCACAGRLQRGMAAQGFTAIDVHSDAAPHHSKSRIHQIRSARSTLEDAEADMLHAGCQKLSNIGDT